MDPRDLLRLVGDKRRSAQDALANRMTALMMHGPLLDAHANDSGPVEFDHFDTEPSCGNTQITGTVGAGNDVTLYAATSAMNEAGLVVVDNTPQWVTSAAGVGGTVSWGIVSLEWGMTGIGANFQALYKATPTSGYGTRAVFALNFKDYRYKPFKGRTILSGGSISVKLVVRPLGTAGAVVPWLGADLTAISSAACTMIDKLQIFAPSNYGPVHTRALFQGNTQAGQRGPGRKALVTELFGGGRISKFVGRVRDWVDPQPDVAK